MKEEWKDIAGYEDLYQVSNYGRVKSLDRISAYRSRKTKGVLLKQSTRKDGYLLVSLWKNGCHYNGLVHQLVARAFKGPRPDGLQVCHEDGVQSNCAASNFRYDTPIGNNRDKRRHGTSSGRDTSGDKNGNAKLNRDQVLSIRARVSVGEKRQDIAIAFGVSHSLVKRIVRRELWPHV